MADFTTKDGRNVTTFTNTFRRMAVSGVPAPIPVESEYLRIRSSSGNATGMVVYVGEADVSPDRGYELAPGDSVQLSGGLGQLIAANTIYVYSTGADGYIHYIASN